MCCVPRLLSGWNRSLPALIGGNGMFVVTGFIRSASRMEAHIFVPRWVFSCLVCWAVETAHYLRWGAFTYAAFTNAEKTLHHHLSNCKNVKCKNVKNCGNMGRYGGGDGYWTPILWVIYPLRGYLIIRHTSSSVPEKGPDFSNLRVDMAAANRAASAGSAPRVRM